MFYDYKRTPLGLKKITIALDVFNTYLQRENTEYAASSKYWALAWKFSISYKDYYNSYRNLLWNC